jgi:hypothetical protein
MKNGIPARIEGLSIGLKTIGDSNRSSPFPASFQGYPNGHIGIPFPCPAIPSDH